MRKEASFSCILAAVTSCSAVRGSRALVLASAPAVRVWASSASSSEMREAISAASDARLLEGSGDAV